MSLAGLIARRGVRLTIARATETRAADGSTTATWASQGTTGALLEDVTVELAQRLWGQGADASIRCTVMSSTDLRLRDGVTVTGGRHDGERFRVTAAPGVDIGSGSDHLELGLTTTEEDFT